MEKYLCPICQDEIIPEQHCNDIIDEQINNEIVTECGHCFHINCLWKAITINPICPICRNDLSFVVHYEITLQSTGEKMNLLMNEVSYENLRQSIKNAFQNINKKFRIKNNNIVIKNDEDISNIFPSCEITGLFSISLTIVEPNVNVVTLQEISEMSHNEFMRYCRRKIKRNKVKMNVQIGDNTVEAIILKKLKRGYLIQMREPINLDLLLHNTSSNIPRRFYFVTKNGEISSMSDSFEMAIKLPPTLSNIEKHYDNLIVKISHDNNCIVSIKS